MIDKLLLLPSFFAGSSWLPERRMGISLWQGSAIHYVMIDLQLLSYMYIPEASHATLWEREHTASRSLVHVLLCNRQYVYVCV